MTSIAAHLDLPGDGREATLALVASLAAISLDLRAQNKAVPLEEVSTFVQLLKNTVEPLPGEAGRTNLLDPAATELLNRALSVSSPSISLTSIPELSEKVNELIGKLERIDDVSDFRELAKLRDFCLAVSQSAQLEMPGVFGASRYPDLS